jgi:alkylation response protein AidB-like acyl-CoA dehydrogenase
VSAKKAFASGSPQGDILVTSAPYEDPDAGWQVLHFAVSMKADGVSIGDDWKVHGMRATGSQTVTLDDVLVPEATVVLRRPRGPFHEVFNLVVGAALPLISAVYLGVAESAAEIATKIAKSNAAANDVQWAMGEMRSSLVLTQTLYAQMMRLVNDLDFVPSLAISDEILILKSAAVDAARITVERAMEAVGGRGFYRATGLEQLLRDVRAFHYHPMPAKQQVRFTGRLALGLDPID